MLMHPQQQIHIKVYNLDYFFSKECHATVLNIYAFTTLKEVEILLKKKS